MKTTTKLLAALSLLVTLPGLSDDTDEFGGMTTKPGTPKGKVAIVDTQDSVPSNVFQRVAATFKRDTMFDFVYQRGGRGEPRTLAAESGAAVTLVLVDDDATPSMLLAPDEYWGVVNVRKLSRNLKTEKAKKRFYANRCANEAMRALALLCGGGASQYPKNVMNVSRIEDLDFCTADGIPADQKDKFNTYLRELGVRPEVTLMYEDACQEGWAPAPTNAIQKAIWDKIHELPKNPMKIKFDPNKGR